MSGQPDYPIFRGGDGVDMQFDGKSFSFQSNRPEFFRAKITGSDGTDPIAYSWVELQDDSAGTGWEENENGRSGTTDLCPAYEFNNTEVPDESFVWMREKCFSEDANSSLVYEFAYGSRSAPPPSFPTTVVTSVQCTGNQLIIGYQEIE